MSLGLQSFETPLVDYNTCNIILLLLNIPMKDQLQPGYGN